MKSIRSFAMQANHEGGSGKAIHPVANKDPFRGSRRIIYGSLDTKTDWLTFFVTDEYIGLSRDAGGASIVKCESYMF